MKEGVEVIRSNNYIINQNMKMKIFSTIVLALIFEKFGKIMKDLLEKSTMRCNTRKDFRLPMLEIKTNSS